VGIALILLGVLVMAARENPLVQMVGRFASEKRHLLSPPGGDQGHAAHHRDPAFLLTWSSAHW